jgi:hypothetical protein
MINMGQCLVRVEADLRAGATDAAYGPESWFETKAPCSRSTACDAICLLHVSTGAQLAAKSNREGRPVPPRHIPGPWMTPHFEDQ